jgi:hypothetical protein
VASGYPRSTYLPQAFGAARVCTGRGESPRAGGEVWRVERHDHGVARPPPLLQERLTRAGTLDHSEAAWLGERGVPSARGPAGHYVIAGNFSPDADRVVDSGVTVMGDSLDQGGHSPWILLHGTSVERRPCRVAAARHPGGGGPQPATITCIRQVLGRGTAAIGSSLHLARRPWRRVPIVVPRKPGQAAAHPWRRGGRSLGAGAIRRRDRPTATTDLRTPLRRA